MNTTIKINDEAVIDYVLTVDKWATIQFDNLRIELSREQLEAIIEQGKNFLDFLDITQTEKSA